MRIAFIESRRVYFNQFLSRLIAEACHFGVINTSADWDVVVTENLVGLLALLFYVAAILYLDLGRLLDFGCELIVVAKKMVNLGHKWKEVVNMNLRTRDDLVCTERLRGRRRAELLEDRVEGVLLQELAVEDIEELGAQLDLLLEPRILVIGNKTESPTLLRKAVVGIILTEQNAIFGTAREHTVRLVDAFRYKVVNEDANISLVASEDERLLATNLADGIDACHETFTGSLFITCCSVDLSCHEETMEDFTLETMVELRWVEKVVPDGVAFIE